MVKLSRTGYFFILFSALFLFFTPGYGNDDEIKVSVRPEKNEISSEKPISAVVQVQHPKNSTVDINTFSMKGAPLKVESIGVKESSPGSTNVLSLYTFLLPGKASGLYLISPISVNVDGKTYRSGSVSYRVIADPEPTTPAPAAGKGPFLQLGTFIDGSSNLYPGQKIRVGYRLYFNDNFDLDQTVFPLTEANGFKKIGNERINDAKESVVSVRQIDREIEAVTPGKYSFGPSYVIASLYRNDSNGKERKIKEGIRAEAPPVTLEVLAFPEEGKPPSFNGSTGENIQFSVALAGPSEVSVGDKISLSVEFTGPSDDLSNIKLPDLCCLPGFAGFFTTDDIPPLPTEEKGKLTYKVSISPVVEKIAEIPPIEFSYFDVINTKYVTLKSGAIPIKITPAKKTPPKDSAPAAKAFSWPKPIKTPEPVEIKTIYPLEKSDLDNYFFGSPYVLWIIPLGILFIFLEIEILKRHAQELKRRQIKSGKDLLEEAKVSHGGFSRFYNLLTKALLMILFENKIIKNYNISIVELPEEGIGGDVKHLLFGIEEVRFSGKGDPQQEEIVKKAEEIVMKIQKTTEGVSHE